MANTTLKN
jgi:hypothetical protein